MGIKSTNGIVFRGLVQKDIALLEKWYGMKDQFGYATGFKNFLEIKQKLLEPIKPDALISMIDIAEDNKTIGFIYGEFKKTGSKTILWIHILIVEPAYQRRGLGTSAVNKLLQDVKLYHRPLTCIAAVSEKNIPGLSFWSKVGFTRSESMEESLYQLGTSNVAIFQKAIT